MNPDQQKSPFLSKTLWMNLVVAIAAFFPSVQSYIASNPMVTVMAFAGANFVLRLLSKDKLTLS